MNAYRTDTIVEHGKTYLIEWFYDQDTDPLDHDGHGDVTGWTNRSKRPGELVIASDRFAKRFYDFAGAVKRARADGWDSAPYNDGTETKGQQADKAARADYEYLRRWFNDDWHYCGIMVTLLDDAGDRTRFSDSLWGVEDDGYLSQGYHSTVIRDLIGEVEYQENSAVFPVSRFGI